MGSEKLKNGQRVCEEVDGQLPLPKSEIEVMAIQSFAEDNYTGVKKFQLNLNDTQKEGSFVKIHGDNQKDKVCFSIKKKLILRSPFTCEKLKFNFITKSLEISFYTQINKGCSIRVLIDLWKSHLFGTGKQLQVSQITKSL